MSMDNVVTARAANISPCLMHQCLQKLHLQAWSESLQDASASGLQRVGLQRITDVFLGSAKQDVQTFKAVAPEVRTAQSLGKLRSPF